MKIKIKEVGDICRHCGTPVVLKESDKLKKGKPCTYTHYLWCFVCKAIYFVPEYKLNKQNLCQSQQSLSFVNPITQSLSPLAQTALSSSKRLKVRSHRLDGSTRLLSSTELQFKNLMERLKKVSDSYSGKKDDTVYCPDCSSKMIKRANSWGKGFWWGCSSFPKCRKTKKCN